MPRTRIVCTLGPATSSDERIGELIRAGMNVARLNFSHGTHDEHAQNAERVRRIAAQEKAVVAMLGDLQGPKIRVGEIPNGVLELTPDEIIRFELTGRVSDPTHIPLDDPLLARVLKAGDRFLMDDGALEVQVESVTEKEIVARVVHGGVLKSHKGVNLPGVELPVPSLTEKDLADLEWALGQDLDYLALSFVRRAQDVEDLRSRIESHGAHIPIIAKIEKREAVAEIDSILRVADGVMVARGDLGVEMPAEQVPIFQKKIILKANVLGKPVITATQMLESMTHNPRPTRAEASDVANAILDGSDAVMLSGETSIGEYPIQAVKAMANIAEFTEKNLHDFLTAGREFGSEQLTVTDAIGQATCEVAKQVGAKLIIPLTLSGYSARMIARHRPEIPIFAVTVNPHTQRRLALVWGAQAALIEQDLETDQVVHAAMDAARNSGLVQRGDRVVITAGVPTGVTGKTNMIQVREIE